MEEWKIKFGGGEQDEVEGEGEDGDDEDSSEDEEGEEDLRKKRKRAKTSPRVSADRVTKKPFSPVVSNDQGRREEDLGRSCHRLSVAPSHIIARSPDFTHQVGRNATSFNQRVIMVVASTIAATTILFGCLHSIFNSPLMSSSSARQDHRHSHTDTK